jgi:hypothetical protein
MVETEVFPLDHLASDAYDPDFLVRYLACSKRFDNLLVDLKDLGCKT